MSSLESLANALDDVPARVAEAVGRPGDEALRRRPGPDEWSAIEVVGHIVDKMGIWRQRVQLIAAEDRPVLELYDQDRLVQARGYQTAALEELLAISWERCRTFAQVLRNLPPESANRRGLHAEYGEITLLRCVEIPLESIDAHLEQLRAALRLT